jgi:hypothetical protein
MKKNTLTNDTNKNTTIADLLRYVVVSALISITIIVIAHVIIYAMYLIGVI